MLFRIIPVKENRILFYSYSGKDCSDSPRCIAEHLRQVNPDIEIIWAVKGGRKKIKEQIDGQVIEYNSLAHIYYGTTAKVIVTNTGPYKAIKYRNSQVIINTWHGGGAYKKTGMDNPYKNKYQYLYNKNLGQSGVTLFVSSSKLFTKYVIQGAFNYKGDVIECGLPRNDQLFDYKRIKENSDKVRKYYRLDPDMKIVLYAPTWRNYVLDEFEQLNVSDLLNSLEKRFGGKWKFIYRGHNLSNSLNLNEFCDAINATDYPEMQELLCATDFLISDYSSCIWDYSILQRPTILFVPDIEKYNEAFAFYTPISTWGFEIAKNNIELNKIICTFDQEQAKLMISTNHEYFGDKESGNATLAIVNYIINS